MTVNDLISKLSLTPVVLSDPEREVTGGYVGDLLSWVMSKAEAGNAWITIMSNINIAAVAALVDVSCIVLAEGVELDENVKAVAKDKNINVLSCEKSAFELAALIASECR